MEFLGQKVTKISPGFGVFEGKVQSYNPGTKLFTVVYNNGQFEEAGFEDVALLVDNSLSENDQIEVGDDKLLGRKPKRRRKLGLDPGKFGPTSALVSSDDNNNVENDDKLLDGLDLNVEVEEREGEVRECIDLNLSVEGVDGEESVEKAGGFGEEEGVGEGVKERVEEKKERGFDLNVGFGEEGIEGLVSVDVCYGNVGLGEEMERNGGVGVGKNVGDDASYVDSSKKKEEGIVGLEKGGLGDVMSEGGSEGGNSSRRKRRRVGKNGDSTPATVLRRSARRAKTAALNEIKALEMEVEDGVNDVSTSGVTDEVEEKPRAVVMKKSVESGAVPSKPVLPPSSNNLNLDGISVSDLFSVYSCLRSFSTLLYLSPFLLEDLVAALKSRISNLLIDYIHVCVLQTLRKRLEFLANEGCEKSSSCLRNLNWDLLDVITWPVYMIEYLVIFGSRLKPSCHLESLNLFDGEYYGQPADVKLELLRCLCDDVIEVDVIRSELSRRMSTTDVGMEMDRTITNGHCRKRRMASDAVGDSCLSEDAVEENIDGNSDECCLCKMDGNLICCDGCPAAYHSKCVGIVGSVLPDGDWYCPECVIGRATNSNKRRKSVRGAELLGTDVYGLLYFCCFDYLLVSDSCDGESSFTYYHKDDLNPVIQLLSSSRTVYGRILNAILQHWTIDIDSGLLKSDDKVDGKKPKGGAITQDSGNIDSEAGSGAVTQSMEVETLLTSSEGSAEVLQANASLLNPSELGSNVSGQRVSGRSSSGGKKRKKNCSSAAKRAFLSKANEEDRLQRQCEDVYVNRYSFAQTAASVVEELLRKPSDKAAADLKTEEEIISVQLKFILNKATRFCWTTMRHLNAEIQREKCGWCYCCRFPVEGRDCLFSFISNRPVPVGLRAEIDAVLLKRDEKGHLVDVICFVLSMEERLRGLLLGPWLSPQYSDLWRKSVLQASDASSLKRPLLMLESNLRPSALSEDWWKYVDSIATVGSASYFMASTRVTSRNGTNKRKGRSAGGEVKSLRKAGGGLTLFWWRGGKISRSLYNWKAVPRTLAVQAARKAGNIKIPGIQYPEGSESARRSKSIVWRGSVEASASLEQLALQLRELDMSILWHDVENTHPHVILDKESLKSIRLFKKAIIRRKNVGGTSIKYLIDFGKRRSVPDVVLKHGVKLEDSSCEKKRYWLEESHVPLYLLKIFEERRITRKAVKNNSSKLRKGCKVTMKPLRQNGFDYLFLRAERAGSYQCGHCNKNVPISEAVTCQTCSGFFHKRHVIKSSEAITAKCTYTCHRCRSGKRKNDKGQGNKKLGNLRNAKLEKVQNAKLGKSRIVKSGKPQKGKLGKLRNAKKLIVVGGRRSARLRAKPGIGGKALAKPGKGGKALAKRPRVRLRKEKVAEHHEQPSAQKNVSVSSAIGLRRSARQAKKLRTDVDGDEMNGNDSEMIAMEETPEKISWQKRRTHSLLPFWKDGLMLSRKASDERVFKFQKKKLIIAPESSTVVDGSPKCSLCSEQAFQPAAVYISCEMCGDWFHGDAFGLSKEYVDHLIGFKCHVCLERSPPVCPFIHVSTDNICGEATNEAAAHVTQDTAEAAMLHEAANCLQGFPSNKSSPCFSEVQTVDDSDCAAVQDKAVDPDLMIHEATDCLQGFPSNKSSPCFSEVQTVDDSDCAAVHDKAVDPDLMLHEATDCQQGFPSNKSSPRLPEVQTVDDAECATVHDTSVDSCMRVENGSLDSDMIVENGFLDSELAFENGFHSAKEVRSNAIESQNGPLTSSVVTESEDNENGLCEPKPIFPDEAGHPFSMPDVDGVVAEPTENTEE